MTSIEPNDELHYHLRELRADLGLIRANLEMASSTRIDRSVVRAWVEAEALLAHDLEVHFPRALALLGAAPLPSVGPSEPRAGDAESLAAVARDANRLVGAALVALSIDPDPASPTTGVISAAQTSAAAHKMISEMQALAIRLAEAS